MYNATHKTYQSSRLKKKRGYILWRLFIKGTLGLIGNTPLVEPVNLEKELGLEATILVKLEYLNPAGSVKDRVAKAMIEDAEEKGLLKRRFRYHRTYIR